MTTNAEAILNFLKKNYGKEFSKQEIAEELGISVNAVTGTMNALIAKKRAVTSREESVEEAPATETRKAKVKVVKYHTLTEAGLAYDPVAEAEAKAAEIAARKAARAAEKAAKAQE